MSARRPWTPHWQPPETEDERELRLSLVTPKRARRIRAEIEADPVATLRAEVPVERGGCELCGRAPSVDCYLPERVCPRASTAADTPS